MAGPVRIGVIGLGFGARVVVPAFDQTEGCKVVDVVSPREDELVSALCARTDVDLIAVHSPPFLHLSHVTRAAEAGHAVLCDKPFGRNAEEAARMAGLAHDAGVLGMLNFEFRRDPSRERLRELVLGGAVGEPEHMHCSTFLAITRVPLRPFGWLFDAELGGGWIGAWGSHLIDFFRWTFGDVVEATARCRTTIEERPDGEGRVRRCTAEDGFTAALASVSGTTAGLDSSCAAPVSLPPAMIVAGSEGVIEVGSDGRVVIQRSKGETENIDTGRPDSVFPMGRYAAAIRDSVVAGEANERVATFADGLECARVMDAFRAELTEHVEDPTGGTGARSV